MYGTGMGNVGTEDDNTFCVLVAVLAEVICWL
jgi:hypothetical protein